MGKHAGQEFRQFLILSHMPLYLQYLVDAQKRCGLWKHQLTTWSASPGWQNPAGASGCWQGRIKTEILAERSDPLFSACHSCQPVLFSGGGRNRLMPRAVLNTICASVFEVCPLT